MSLPNEENAEKEAVGSSIDFTRVHDDEFLFRAVPNQPSFIKEDGSVTSAALKDSHGGVSVDRDGGRQDADVIHFFCETQNSLVQNGLKKPIEYAKFLKIKTSVVRENECDVDPKPLDQNPFHAEITQNGSGNLKSSTARKIVKIVPAIDNSFN